MAFGAMALTGLLAVGCSELEQDPEALMSSPLTIYLQTPGEQFTRAYLGDVNAVSAEETLHSLRVWLFDNTNGQLLDFQSPETVGSSVTMSLPQYIVNQDRTVDVYVIGNAESAGLTDLTNAMTREQLEALMLTGTAFTPAAKTQAVPATGLPYSQIKKDWQVTENKAVKTNLETINLTRAVSKVRFAFARQRFLGGVEVTGIKINGGVIAEEEKIFPLQSTDNYAAPYNGDAKCNITADKYLADALLYGSDATGTDATVSALITTTAITELDEPEKSVYAESGMEPQAYDTYIDATVGSKYLTYLRESDRQLTGSIYYRTEAGGEILKADFTMDAADDFVRNHSWIVYAYFSGGKLYVKPMVADWIDTPPLDYTIDMSTNMRLFDSWLYRYDTIDQDYTNWTNWAGSHIAVSSGRVETPVAPETVAGRPLRSPQIQLVTSGSGNFDLTVDNSDFEIVRANKDATGVVTSYDASTDGTLTIAAADNVYTYFYVVPKEGVVPANPIAKVSLIYNDPVMGKQKVTFNNNVLPGYSDDSSEIWVYYFPEEEYTINGKLKMYYQNVANPLVPTPVQS
ncbi:MAG: hypothetical protein IJ176_01180 [Prevotella sp.]|nr:hypothetical protein [Prevotella sp.]